MFCSCWVQYDSFVIMTRTQDSLDIWTQSEKKCTDTTGHPLSKSEVFALGFCVGWDSAKVWSGVHKSYIDLTSFPSLGDFSAKCENKKKFGIQVPGWAKRSPTQFNLFDCKIHLSDWFRCPPTCHSISYQLDYGNSQWPGSGPELDSAYDKIVRGRVLPYLRSVNSSLAKAPIEYFSRWDK